MRVQRLERSAASLAGQVLAVPIHAPFCLVRVRIDGTLRDLTSQTQFKSARTKTAAGTKAGVVSPVADGVTTISIAVRGEMAPSIGNRPGAGGDQFSCLTPLSTDPVPTERPW